MKKARSLLSILLTISLILSFSVTAYAKNTSINLHIDESLIFDVYVNYDIIGDGSGFEVLMAPFGGGYTVSDQASEVYINFFKGTEDGDNLVFFFPDKESAQGSGTINIWPSDL